MSKTPALDTAVLRVHTERHPRFWRGDVLDAQARRAMQRVAKAYQAFLNFPEGVTVEDITFTGSLTGLNYTKHSDVDLHFHVRYRDIARDQALVQELLDTKRGLWEELHEIRIYGFTVELYVENIPGDATTPAAGHYSILTNTWVEEAPEPEAEALPGEEAVALARELAEKARAVEAIQDFPAFDKAAQQLQSEVKKIRQRGLSSREGIFSAPNLAFKILRNSGTLDRIWERRVTDLDHHLTLTENAQLGSPHPPMHYVISESQRAFLKEAMDAQATFLQECASEGKLLSEGLLQEADYINQLSQKLKGLLTKGGPTLLRKSLLAAVVGGSLLMSTESLAAAAKQAGLADQEVAALTQELKAAEGQAGEGSMNPQQAQAELAKLNGRFVVDNADQGKTKQYMRFTGNLSDITGFGENGYPLFKKGSASEQAFTAAFAGPRIEGIVNVKGQNFPGQFVKANGLFYNVADQQAQAGAPAQQADPQAIPASPTAGADENRPSVDEQGVMFDFSGLMAQAKERFNYKKRGSGTVTDVFGGQSKTYTSFLEYAYDFVRQSGTGLEKHTNDQIDALFANGLKVRVPHAPQAAK